MWLEHGDLGHLGNTESGGAFGTDAWKKATQGIWKSAGNLIRTHRPAANTAVQISCLLPYSSFSRKDEREENFAAQHRDYPRALSERSKPGAGPPRIVV